MAISTRQVKNKRDSNGVLTGRPGTVYDVNIKYTAPDGKKKSYAKKGFATKKEAAQHEAEMKTKLQNPGQVASITSQRKQTVAAYLNDWVESYARVNLRPSTYDGYKKTIANYINPYIGGVTLNQLTPAMVDKMFQQIIDKGLKPSTAAGAKRVLSVALSHARKYRYIETNAAKDTLTKFGKGDKTPDPYTPEQVKALMQRVEGTVWEMPVILGGLYGMRRSEILGLRWRNVIWRTTPLMLPSSYLSRYRQKQKSLKKWHRRNPTAESYPLRSLPARSSSNSLPCRKYRKNRQ